MLNHIDEGLDVYITETELRTSQGQWPHPPATVEQLAWVADTYPEQAAWFLPSTKELKHIALPATLVRCEPFCVEFRERFLTTLLDEPEFATAVRVALNLEDHQ